MISDEPIIKKVAWASGTRRASTSMETHREYVGYLDEWDGTERLTDEEIVRCGDCKHFASDELGDCCTLLGFEDVKPMDNGFCAWGERRDA